MRTWEFILGLDVEDAHVFSECVKECVSFFFFLMSVLYPEPSHKKETFHVIFFFFGKNISTIKKIGNQRGKVNLYSL